MNTEIVLQHHGILGMKWGIRRYQNPDGSLTAKGRQRYLNSDGSFNVNGQKWYRKAHRDKYFNKQTEYDDEFDNSPVGKKLLAEYLKQIDRMESAGAETEDWPQSEWDKFYNAEQNYLKAMTRYTADKIVKEYGTEKVAILESLSPKEFTDAEKLVEEIVERNWYVHGYV